MKLTLRITFAYYYCASFIVGLDCNRPTVNVYSGGNYGYDGETCDEKINAKLDEISLQLVDIEKKMAETKFSEFKVIFRANAGVEAQNLVVLWEGTDGSNADVPEAAEVNGNFMAPYKSTLVENWGALDIRKVKFAFYEEGIEVMTLIFNGIGTNKNNWFDKDRIIQTPYPDMLTSSFNHFGVNPGAGNCGGNGRCRMWYISRNHGGCPNDAGWVAVTSHEACLWDTSYGPAPRFLYSNESGFTNWQNNFPVGNASVMAISIQAGVL